MGFRVRNFRLRVWDLPPPNRGREESRRSRTSKKQSAKNPKQLGNIEKGAVSPGCARGSVWVVPPGCGRQVMEVPAGCARTGYGRYHVQDGVWVVPPERRRTGYEKCHRDVKLMGSTTRMYKKGGVPPGCTGYRKYHQDAQDGVWGVPPRCTRLTVHGKYRQDVQEQIMGSTIKVYRLWAVPRVYKGRRRSEAAAPQRRASPQTSLSPLTSQYGENHQNTQEQITGSTTRMYRLWVVPPRYTRTDYG